MDGRLVIGHFRAGAIDDEKLNRLIAGAWRDAIVDPVDGAEIATILGVARERLSADRSPITAEISAGGITGAEMVLLFAGAFAGAFAKEFGSEVGKGTGKATIRLIRKIWDKTLSRRIRFADPEALGEEVTPQVEPY
jgi:hypothetical protein